MVVTAKISLFSLPSLNPLALEVVLHQCPHHPANTLQLCPRLFIPNVEAFASVLARNVTLTFLLWKYVDFSICAHELSFLQLFFFSLRAPPYAGEASHSRSSSLYEPTSLGSGLLVSQPKLIWHVLGRLKQGRDMNNQ